MANRPLHRLSRGRSTPGRLAWGRLISGRATPGPLALPWPLPALLCWAAGWAACAAAGAAGSGAGVALAAGLLVASAGAAACSGWRRRSIAGAGFPLSALVMGLPQAAPAWVWLALLAPVLVLYPPRAWRDAPLFPTPAGALAGLDAVVGTPARVLDAGCGLGHGVAALRALWPQAEVHGIEWSPLLACIARARHPASCVRRGDMWAASWAGHDLVYLFQRPESMARAWRKAQQELAPGAWLVSLEFAVPDAVAEACLQGPARRPVWVYRVGGSTGPGAGR